MHDAVVTRPNPIIGLPYEPLNGLHYCNDHGVAYQPDRTRTIAYNQDYFDHYARLRGTPIARQLNRFRVAFALRHSSCLLDIGIGSGEFMEAFPGKIYGFDINPVAVDLLRRQERFVDPYRLVPAEVDGWTLWDTLEHIPEPQLLLDRVPANTHVFISLPIFPTLKDVVRSKHYKPDEHYYYFTHPGFVKYMAALGFSLVEDTDAETRIGRESIHSFAFRKRDE